MPTFNEVLNAALARHQSGQLAEADELYRALLAAAPAHAGVCFYRSVLLGQLGKLEESLQHIEMALATPQPQAPFYRQLGQLRHRLGQPQAAIEAYRAALALDPQLADVHAALASVYHTARHLVEAGAAWREALRLEPDAAEWWVNLGSCYLEQNQTDDAIDALRTAVRLRPEMAAAWNNLGNAWQAKGNFAEAIAAFEKAIERSPRQAETHYNLGNVRLRIGEYQQAIASYEQALALRPEHAGARNNLGLAREHLGDRAGALEAYNETLRLHPQHLRTLRNLAHLHWRQGRTKEAGQVLLDVIRARPDHVRTYQDLGDLWSEQHDYDRASEAYKEALRFEPENIGLLSSLAHGLHYACRWNEVPDLEARLEAALERPDLDASVMRSPFVAFNSHVVTTSAQQQRYARQWAALLKRDRTADLKFPHQPRPAHDRIRLAYLSSDLHDHATAILIAELIEKHDRNRFSVTAYSRGEKTDDPMRQRLERAFDVFLDVHDETEEAVAQRIFADGIDILVDLKGYTHNNVATIMSYRPAPVQVNYLGFPGTMGADFIDYILVDEFIVPRDQIPFYDEKPVFLPGCYQVNDGTRSIAASHPTRGEMGLPEEAFVFCCFNNSYKISPRMFDVWMRLLRQVPGSVLWILSGNRYMVPNIYREAEARGVPPERIVFCDVIPLQDHLARVPLADLFLDTFPVTAHTTASDTLWAGCPLLTRIGETFISRVAGSLLHTLGLPELIAHSDEEYEAIALRCATDRQWLHGLRSRLAENRATSDLFRGDAFARKVEAAYEIMWRRYLASQSPESFTVRLDG